MSGGGTLQNKIGFTLIELLAVIVILAIIALIATPIVLNIINESKESANLRSAEMYVGAVEQAISIEKMNNTNFNPFRCEIKEKQLYCDEEEVKVEVNGEVPDRGVIYFINGQVEGISLEYKDKTISTNTEGNLHYGNMEKICFPVTEKNKTTGNVPSGEHNKGDEYICEVSLGDFHRFFVLSKEENKVSLIMDRNIASDGTEVTDENIGSVLWQTSGENSDGPVTVMDYLYKATKNWENIPNIIMNYKDQGNVGNYGYGKIETIDNITKITKKDGTLVLVLTDKEGYENLKARLPKTNEIYIFDTDNETNLWMYNYLGSSSKVTGEGLHNVKKTGGYWTLSSYYMYNDQAIITHYTGSKYPVSVTSNNAGIRPVIELLENNMVGGAK